MSTVTRRFMAHGSVCTIRLELPARVLGVAAPTIEWTPCAPSGLSQRDAVDVELLLRRACSKIVDEALAAARGNTVTRQQREPGNTLELDEFSMQSARP